MDKTTEEIANTKVKEGATISAKPNAAYDLISRNLTEKDLKTPAVVKMIINERDRLQIENTQMKDWQDKYHVANSRSLVLEEKMKSASAFEVISTAAVGTGFLLIGVGLSPSLNYAYISIGVILVAAGILAKVIRIK